MRLIKLKVGYICIYIYIHTHSYAHMQSALDIDAMRLITLKVGDASFDPEDFLSIFDPFDGIVWLATLGMFFLGAIFMWMTEGDRDNEDYKHSHRYACMYVCMYVFVYVDDGG
jgi:hypothetical protein